MNFVADRMLGKLAKQLRMLGHDTVYYRGEDAYGLIKLAREEGRVILTRNTKLLPRAPEDRIVRIEDDNPSLQIRELIQKGYISLNEENLLSRCLLCNVPLHDTPREEVDGKVPEFIFYQHKEFYQCPQCLKIYWQGSHQENMLKRIEELKNFR